MSTDSWSHDGATTRGSPPLAAGGHNLYSDDALSPEVSGVRPGPRWVRAWRARYLLRLVAVAAAICAMMALIQSLAQTP